MFLPPRELQHNLKYTLYISSSSLQPHIKMVDFRLIKRMALVFLISFIIRSPNSDAYNAQQGEHQRHARASLASSSNKKGNGLKFLLSYYMSLYVSIAEFFICRKRGRHFGFQCFGLWSYRRWNHR